jgi:outer membrane protein assembly factor BamB
MDFRPLLRLLAVLLLVAAAVLMLALRARRGLPSQQRRTRGSRILAGALAVLAIAGFVLSLLDVFAQHAPVPGALSIYYVRDDSTGQAIEAAAAATGAIRWRYTPSTGGLACRLPTLANGVFYLSIGNTFHAVRASDGQQLWTASIEGRLVQGTPAVAQGVIYATTTTGVFALHATDGSQLWHKSWNSIAGATSASATLTSFSAAQVANNIVYVAVTLSAGGTSAVQETTVSALDASDGTLRWRQTVEGPGVSSLTVVDGIVYVVLGAAIPPVGPQTAVYALTMTNGTIRWKHALDQAVTTLTVAEGAVYLRSIALGLVALDAAAGTLLWQRRDLGASSSPVVANGVVYLSALLINSNPAGAVLALDARDGHERWRTLLVSAEYVTLAGQTLYVGGDSAYALRADDGHVVWRYGSRAVFYQPVVADGVVFIASSNPPNSLTWHPFGIGSQDFLNVLDARTGGLYWRTSGGFDCAPVLLL